MVKETDIKAVAFDWVFKGLIAVICFLVKDVRDDVKQLMQSVPAIKAEVDILKDQRLMDKFRRQKLTMLAEDEITYDTLKRKK